MRKYEAKIVGFKWSRKKMGYYYPIFEYIDGEGETKQYIRRKGIEKTPFIEREKYYICEKKGRKYERTEKKFSLKQYSFFFIATAILSLLIMLFINARIALLAGWIALSLFNLRRIAKYLKRIVIKKTKLKREPIQGQIIGYHTVKMMSLIDGEQIKYRPLIEYVYGDSIYTHISKTICDENAYTVNSPCNICLDINHSVVYDELELSAPIIDVKKILATCKAIIGKMTERTIKQYHAPNKPVVQNQQMTDDTIPIVIPLKTYDYKRKVSGWY